MFSNRDMEERKKIPAKFCREGVQSALNLPAGAEKLCWKTENGAEKREEEEKADMKCLKLLSALGAAVKNETGDVREGSRVHWADSGSGIHMEPSISRRGGPGPQGDGFADSRPEDR